MPKMRVSFRDDRRSWYSKKPWEVWEYYPGPNGGKSKHHSFHATEKEARAAARAQAAQDRRDAEADAAKAMREITGSQFDDAY